MSSFRTHRRLQAPGRGGEGAYIRAMLVLQGFGMVSTGSGTLGHLQSGGIYEDIEVVPVQKRQATDAGRGL